MRGPSIQRVALHGFYGSSSSRLLSLATRGWYPYILSVGETIVEALVNPSSFSNAWMDYIAIGESNASAQDAFSLVDEIHRKSSDVYANRNTYFASATFGLDEPTGDDLQILEIGIFNASSEGDMGIRWTLNTVLDKDNLDDIVVECAITVLHES